MMKIWFLIIVLFFTSCSSKEVVEEKEKSEVLRLIEVKRSDESSWFDDFQSYRENYRRFKVNSDLFLGIGQYSSDPNEAFESAIKNGEDNIKSSLSVSSTFIENYGSILDQVLEIYNRGSEVYYRYILLMEVNRVSLITIAEEEELLIRQARAQLEFKRQRANEIIQRGDRYFLSRDYDKAILSYEEALIILRDAEQYSAVEIVEGKISSVRDAIMQKEYRVNTERMELDRNILLLESKSNPTLYDLKELLILYEKKGTQTRVNEVKEMIRLMEARLERELRVEELRSYIKNLVRDGYIEENYEKIYNNPELYFYRGRLDSVKVEESVYRDISDEIIYILLPRSLYNNINVGIFIQIIQEKNPDSLIKYNFYDGNISQFDLYKYQSNKIFYVRSLNLSSTRGNFGYFSNFSLDAVLIDYKNNTQKVVNYTNRRSRFTDYSNEIGAKEGVLNETLEAF